MVNVRRPAWDDLEVAVVVDTSNPAVSELLGEHVALEDLDRLLDPRFDRGGAYFLPHDEFDTSGPGMAMERGTVHGAGAEGWHPDDMLIAPRVGADGELLGFLSLDDPRDGRRPSDALMESLAAVAAGFAATTSGWTAAATRTDCPATRSPWRAASPRSPTPTRR